MAEYKTVFAIGCLVQWYECDIIHEYVDSLKDALDLYDGYVHVDFVVSMNQNLEECESDEQFQTCIETIKEVLSDDRFVVSYVTNLVTIADYRRKFNEDYCESADVLIWGESDALLPKQLFVILNELHDVSLYNKAPKYLATFGICKMWDDTWKPLEHVAFTDKPFIPNDYENWWSVKYTMTKEEMNHINDTVSDIDLRVIHDHKFNGCGLVISSEVIKSGVNIPKSIFFVHEDTAFMLMTQKLLGGIPQYIIKNILLVHNRNHSDKRKYIRNETGVTLNEMRRSNTWYNRANRYCEENCYNLFNPHYESKSWDDVDQENK